MFAKRLVADGRNGLGNQPPRSIGSSASRLLKELEAKHASRQEWRTVWLWIESGAPYVGSYAGLRNEADQALAGLAVAAIFERSHALLQRRCAPCHESDPDGEAKPLPLTAEWNRKNKQRLGRPTGAYERIVTEHDPIARFSRTSS